MDARGNKLRNVRIAVYKKIRSRIANGTVYHVTSIAANGHTDALESFNPADGTALAYRAAQRHHIEHCDDSAGRA